VRVLVAYATFHGSTQGIAEHIGRRLSGRGVEVDVLPVQPPPLLAGYDAVIAGSAIHGGAWLEEGTGFMQQNGEELGKRPLWLFSVGSVGERSSAFGRRFSKFLYRMLKQPKGIAPLWPVLQPRGHHWFAGVVEPAQWGSVGGAFMKLFGGRYGDLRNWQEIDDWTDSIASALGQ